MPYGPISDYRGLVGDVVEQGMNVFVEVYNTVTTTLSNGAVYKIVPTADTTTGNYPTLAAIAQDTVGITEVGVVNNSIMDKGVDGIAGSSWGYVQTRGECPKVSVAGGTVAIGDSLEAVAAAATLLGESTTLDIDVVGVARSATTAATGSVSATLLGFRCKVD